MSVMELLVLEQVKKSKADAMRVKDVILELCKEGSDVVLGSQLVMTMVVAFLFE